MANLSFIKFIGKSFFLLFGLLIFTACSIFPYGSYKNEPIYENQLFVERASVDYTRNNNASDTFIGVAISGGGSRAANFGAAVLQIFDEIGFLNHVTVISSVSGGSLAAAYYALYARSQNENMEWTKMRNAMGQNLFSSFVIHGVKPWNIAITAFTDYDRSDLMASVFDQKLFGGASFGDIETLNPDGPKLLLNATTANLGTRFIFSEEDFSRLGSRLDTYPLAWAVMASGAFPTIFHNVTLRNYRIDEKKTFLHIYDGGPSDNLALESLLTAARNHYINTVRSEKPYKGCFIFLIDSYVNPKNMWSSLISDGRLALIDYITDRNALDAINTLLTQRRHDTLASAGLPTPTDFRNFGTRIDLLFEPPLTRVEQDDVFLSLGQIDLFYDFGQYFQMAADQGYHPIHNSIPRVICKIWHLNFHRILSLRSYYDAEDRKLDLPPYDADAKTDLGPDSFSESYDEFARDVARYRLRRFRMVENIATSYNLSGISRCDAEDLQEAIYNAAHLLIKEDYEALEQTCLWFAEQGLTVSCPTPVTSTSESKLDDKIDWSELRSRAIVFGIGSSRHMIPIRPQCQRYSSQ